MASPQQVEGFESKPLAGFESKPLGDDKPKKETPTERLARIKKHEAEMGQPVREALIGFGNAALGTAQTLASPIRKAFGMEPAQPPDKPTTTAGKIGAGVEQAAEFAVPEAAAGKLVGAVKLGRAARIGTKAALAGAGTAGVAAVQGDERPLTAGAVGAAGPLLEGSGPALYKWLRNASKDSLGKFFGSSALEPKHIRKAIQQIVPTALDEGIPASWKAWAKQVEGKVEEKGARVASTVAGPAGDVWAPVRPVIDALEELKQKAANVTMNVGTGGQMVPTKIATKDENLLRQIGNFQKKLIQIEGAGWSGQVPARVLHDLKATWNDLVYARRTAGELNTRDLLLNAKKKTARTAVGAIRDVLDQASPQIAEVDKAYRIAKELQKHVLDAAMETTGKIESRVAQGVAGAVKRSAGMASGAAAGGSVGYREGGVTGAVKGAIVGGVTGRMLQQAFQSPRYGTLSAVVKNQLAEAIASGKMETVRRLIAPLIAKSTAGKASETPASTKKQGETSKTNPNDPPLKALQPYFEGGVQGLLGVLGLGDEKDKANRFGALLGAAMPFMGKPAMMERLFSERRYADLLKKFGGTPKELATALEASADVGRVGRVGQIAETGVNPIARPVLELIDDPRR